MFKWVTLLLLTLLLASTVSALNLSHEGGFYPTEFNLTITADNMTAVYTLDSTDPRVNGTPVNGSIHIQQRPDAPSDLALNPETALFLFFAPNSTPKATILRVVTYVNGTEIEEVKTSYFVGHDPGDFTVPVISVIIDPMYLDDYDIGMLIKGATYYDDLAANNGNPLNPFRPANWNNDNLRHPGFFELYDGGVLSTSDAVKVYPSGRWSAALRKKSIKFKWDSDIGAKQSTYAFFGAESLPEYRKIRLRQGSQDWDAGVQMRDCVESEIVEDLNVETMNCGQAAFFLNGEYWGLYNLREDVDDKYLAAKYGVDKDDIVLVEKDGELDEGEPGDEQVYLDLKDYLETHNMSSMENHQVLVSQVNLESMIDYYTTYMFFHNDDFPNDHRFWRNKNNASQVNGTPYDGRWYFHPKDKDQSAGIWSGQDPAHNSVDEYLSGTTWSTLFLRAAIQHTPFKDRFVERSLELLNTTLTPANMFAEIDAVADAKRPELQREVERWDKPSSVGSWDGEVQEMKDWLSARAPAYRNFILVVNTTDYTSTTPDPGNQTNGTNETYICYDSVEDLPLTCAGGTITQDTWDGSCRTVVCGAKQVKACDKSDGHFAIYNQVRADEIEVCFGEEYYGGVCMTNWGYIKSADPFPLCQGEAPPEPVCGNDIVEEGEECDGVAPPGFTCVACSLVEDPINVTIALYGVPGIIQQALDYLDTIPGLTVTLS